ncbi:MAG: hypothetical protein ACR2RF_17255 [Geminicoccaceae bacterium]
MQALEKDDAPLISLRDGVISAVISTLALASWSVPETKWPAIAELLARFRLARRGPLSPDERSMVAIVAGARPEGWVDDVYLPKALAHKYLSWMQILACHGPGRWRPHTRLIGREHIERARDVGRGVVLFTATFAYKDLMAKAALAGAGYRVSHVSKDTHGFSETRFGKRWLNPIYTSIEERFLRERMVFGGSNTKTVSARIRDRLKRNDMVMITVTPLGRHVATRPFLNGSIHIATGGLSFASENDTPVLPVFTLRQADGGTTTFVGSALDQPVGAARAEKISAMLDDYVPRLEAHVRHYPDQFSFPLTDQSGTLLLSRSNPSSPAPATSVIQDTAA